MVLAGQHIIGDRLSFTEMYISLRRKESRIYSDAEVRRLPFVASGHPHYHEWKARAQSSASLIKHISAMDRSLRILEVGCGNGWLSNQLSNIPKAEVVGFDVNTFELEQAERVFAAKRNLRFACGKNFYDIQPEKCFDLIVFAAAIQYFPSLTDTIDQALNRLKNDGSIHIIDSHFYNDDKVEAAKKRTAAHFLSLGFPEFSDHYVHHRSMELVKYHPELLYNPRSILNRLNPAGSPFPWIRINRPPE